MKKEFLRAFYFSAISALILPASALADDEPVTDTPDTPAIDRIVWCAPGGNDETADGTEDNPFYDLQKAIDFAAEGGYVHIYMKAGRYVYDKRININDYNGTPEQPVELWGIGGQAILDFSDQPYHPHKDNPYQGIRLTASYWHLKNLDICNASDNGLLIERNKPTGGTAQDVINRTQDGHDNIIEICNFYRNGDAGLQIKNLGAYNRFINCDSYFNCDEDYGDADGFAPKISVGTGNYFYGCRAWNNSDDGWDSYYKSDGGFEDDTVTILENCITYRNGLLEDGSIGANGNGFKCGSEQGASNLYLTRCIAVENTSKGFDQNHNRGDIILNNCTGYRNGANYSLYENPSAGHIISVTNCISIGTNNSYGAYGVNADQFVALDNAAELIGPRNEYGELPETTFAHPVENSWIVDYGKPITTESYRGIPVNPVSYFGNAPDLGAYEFIADGEETGVRKIQVTESEGSISLFQSAGGLLFLTVKDNPANASYTASLYDVAGNLLLRHDFTGCTTSLQLPASAHGIVTLTVQSPNGYRASLKSLLK